MYWRSTIAALLVSGLITLTLGTSLAAGQCGERQMIPAQLDRLLTEGVTAGVVVLDTRSSQDFLAGTIPTAVNITQLQGLINGIHEDRQDAYVVIVTKEGLLDSALLNWMRQLCERKIEIWILQGGVNGWLAQGFGLEKPEERLTVPGAVPFIIPRGLCEMNEPVQEYN